MNITRQCLCRLRLLFGGCFVCVPAVVRAANGQWIGATDANWSTPANWSASPVPGTGDTATLGWSINPNTRYTVSLGAGVTVMGVNFDNSQAGYTIGAGAVGAEKLTLNHGGALAVADGASNVHDQMLNADLVL